MNINRYSEVLNALYKGASDPDEWAAAFEAIAVLLSGYGVALVTLDPVLGLPREMILSGDMGRNTEIMRQYIEYYGAMDPTISLVNSTPEGSLTQCHTKITDDIVRSNEYYNELIIPNGGRFLTGGHVLSNHDTRVTMAVLTGPKDGPLAGDRLMLFQLLMPHLRRAYEIRTKLGAQQAVIGDLTTGLDGLDVGVVLLTADLRIVFNNRAAEEVLRAGDGVAVRRDRLIARTRGNQIELDACCREALRGVPVALSIERDNGPPLALVVCRLAQDRPGARGVPRPKFLVLIGTGAEKSHPRGVLLARVFGLTPAEARLVDALLAGQDLKEISERFQVSIQTVKTQLKSIFSKTNVNRQAELIRLMQGFPSVRG